MDTACNSALDMSHTLCKPSNCVGLNAPAAWHAMLLWWATSLGCSSIYCLHDAHIIMWTLCDDTVDNSWNWSFKKLKLQGTKAEQTTPFFQEALSGQSPCLVAFYVDKYAMSFAQWGHGWCQYLLAARISTYVIRVNDAAVINICSRSILQLVQKALRYQVYSKHSRWVCQVPKLGPRSLTRHACWEWQIGHKDGSDFTFLS